MSTLMTVYAQPATYQAFQLTSYSDMADCLNFLRGKGYTGNITVDASGNWQMYFQSPGQNTGWTASMADWIIIKNGSIASSVPNAQATTLYTTTPPA